MRQLSYWLPEGWDSSAVCAAETLFVASPLDSTGLAARKLQVYLGAGERYRGEPAVRLSTAGEIRTESAQIPRRGIFGYDASSRLLELGSMAAEGGLWISGRPKAAGLTWVDTLRLVISPRDDSVQIRQVRSERRVGSRTVGGELWYEIRSEVRSSISTAARVEQHLEPGGVRAAAALEGLVRERYLYAPASGRTDSLESDGRLAGRIVYAHAAGRADTLRGTWVYRRRGSWRPSGAEARDTYMEYFAVHGRYPDVTPPDLFAPTRERLPSEGLDADSLSRLRARTPSPFDRFTAEEALRTALAQNDSLGAASLDGRPVRSHDALLVAAGIDAYRYRRGERPGVAWAEAVGELLANERLQRELGLNREDLLSTVLSTLNVSHRIAAEGAPVLLGSARRTTDPLGRDLLLLAAYEADPATTRPLIEQLADSLDGYGPLARRYITGDAHGFNASWGVRHGQRPPTDARPFPGDQADAPAHAAYQRAPGGFSIVAVELWFAARGLDAGAEFRRRFAVADSDSDRIVWARYLMMMHDPAPLPWLRDTSALRTGAIARQVEELQRRAPEPVADQAVVVALQNLALLHATCGEVLDTLEKPIGDFSAHDERSGDWFLVSDSLEPAVVERWRHELPVISRDSLQARAQRTGLQMGLVVSRPVRVGTRYVIGVVLLPFTPRGEGCLCGGGSELVFERRGGRWLVTSRSGWVS